MNRLDFDLVESHAFFNMSCVAQCQGIAIALKCGATKAQFDSTVSKIKTIFTSTSLMFLFNSRFEFNIGNKTQVGIHPSSAEEFVTMRTVTRRIAYKAKPKTSL